MLWGFGVVSSSLAQYTGQQLLGGCGGGFGIQSIGIPWEAVSHSTVGGMSAPWVLVVTSCAVNGISVALGTQHKRTWPHTAASLHRTCPGMLVWLCPKARLGNFSSLQQTRLVIADTWVSFSRTIPINGSCDMPCAWCQILLQIRVCILHIQVVQRLASLLWKPAPRCFSC